MLTYEEAKGKLTDVLHLGLPEEIDVLLRVLVAAIENEYTKELAAYADQCAAQLIGYVQDSTIQDI